MLPKLDLWSSLGHGSGFKIVFGTEESRQGVRVVLDVVLRIVRDLRLLSLIIFSSLVKISYH